MTAYSANEYGVIYYGATGMFPAASRLLHFVRNTRFVALVEALALRTDTQRFMALDVTGAFDVDAGVGAQLDRIGGILQLERIAGATDSRYRTLLQIQIELILSSGGTTSTIQRIVELYTGTSPTSYTELYPMSYTIGAVLGPSADAAELLTLLGRATAAAYGYAIVATSLDALILDFSGNAIAGAGILDFSGDAIAGAGILDYMFAA